jgi:hypothetical protein
MGKKSDASDVAEPPAPVSGAPMGVGNVDEVVAADAVKLAMVVVTPVLEVVVVVPTAVVEVVPPALVVEVVPTALVVVVVPPALVVVVAAS